jgi:hypothetical protein
MTALNILALLANTPSTSGSYVFSVTRDQIIRQMMLDIGALGEGDNPTAQEISDSAFKLNLIVKQWMGNTDFAPGMKVWTRKRADLFLGNAKYLYNLGQTGDHWVASTANLTYPNTYGQTSLTAAAAPGAVSLAVATTGQFSINDYVGILIGSDLFWTTVSSIGPGLVIGIPAPGLPAAAGANAYVFNYTTKAVRPLTMIACVLRDVFANDTPLDFMTVERYESLPTKVAPTNIADPAAILYESQFTNQAPNGQLYLDVAGAQDVTKHLHCVYLAPPQDFLNPGDAPDYPQQWFRALVAQLGKDCAGMFDCVWTQDMEDNRIDAIAIARQADPAVTDRYFEVNAENQYGT